MELEALHQWQKENGLDCKKGYKGVENLHALCVHIGYSDIEGFLSNNPDCIEVIEKWICEQTIEQTKFLSNSEPKGEVELTYGEIFARTDKFHLIGVNEWVLNEGLANYGDKVELTWDRARHIMSEEEFKSRAKE